MKWLHYITVANNISYVFHYSKAEHNGENGLKISSALFFFPYTYLFFFTGEKAMILHENHQAIHPSCNTFTISTVAWQANAGYGFFSTAR